MKKLMLTTMSVALLAAPAVAQARRKTSPYTPIYNFLAGNDGNGPQGALIQDANGVLYGTTAIGGPASAGTVFSLTPPQAGTSVWTETVLYSFTGGADGSAPMSALVMDANGNLYGTTDLDGAYGAGTVFMLSPPANGGPWTETTLWSFTGGADGGNPTSKLIFDMAGNLYGTTNYGGTANLGTVFELSPPTDGTQNWVQATLWSFAGGTDGSSPQAGLYMDANSNLYGTTAAGGVNNVGTVFELSPLNDGSGTWTEQLLWNFTGATDGGTPLGALIADSQGNLYGTTQYGGTGNCPQGAWEWTLRGGQSAQGGTGAAPLAAPFDNCGTVFELSPPADGVSAWTENVIFNFDNGPDGANPDAELVFDTYGNLFGTTPDGGAKPQGSLFELTPANDGSGTWSETTPFDFTEKANQGFYPHGGLLLGADGALYGTASHGGTTWVHVKNFGYGMVFRLMP